MQRNRLFAGSLLAELTFFLLTVVRCQQGLRSVEKKRIAAAAVMQECAALFYGQGERLVKQLLQQGEVFVGRLGAQSYLLK